MKCKFWIEDPLYSKCKILFNKPCPYAQDIGRWNGCNRYGEIKNIIEYEI